MTRKEIFMMAVQGRAIVLDIKHRRDYAAKVISLAGGVQDGILEAMDRDEFIEAASEYVNFQYGFQPTKPGWAP